METIVTKEEVLYLQIFRNRRRDTSCRGARRSSRLDQEAKGAERKQGQEASLWFLWEGTGKAEQGRLSSLRIVRFE